MGRNRSIKRDPELALEIMNLNFVSLLCLYCKDMVAKILLLKQLEAGVGTHILGHSLGLVCVSCIHTTQPQPVCLCVQCTSYKHPRYF